MIESSCHCGAVKLEIQVAPAEVTECNCSICRRYGVLWAYYSPAHVHIIANDTATDRYRWGHKSIEFHRCRNCGCVTHWAAAAQPADRMGVNARLMAPEILREFAGAGSTEPIPGEFSTSDSYVAGFATRLPLARSVWFA